MGKMAFFHDFWIPYCNLNIIYHLWNLRDKHCWRDFKLQNLSHLQIKNKFSHFASRKSFPICKCTFFAISIFAIIKKDSFRPRATGAASISTVTKHQGVFKWHKKVSHLYSDIFCHFNFCYNRKIPSALEQQEQHQHYLQWLKLALANFMLANIRRT